MKLTKQYSTYRIVLLLLPFLLSCTLQRTVSQSVHNDKYIKATYQGHNGSHSKCSACIAYTPKKKDNSKIIPGQGKSPLSQNELLDRQLIKSKHHNMLPFNCSKFPSTSTLSIQRANTTVDCDILVLRNGNEIQAKIIEVGISEVKYNKCAYPEGPTYIILKSDVLKIEYSNGNKDVFSEPAAIPKQNVPEVQRVPEASQTKTTELTIAKKYEKGQEDAESNHNGGMWFFAGLLLGLIGLIIASLSNPTPSIITSELASDQAYREGYKKIARGKNVSNALLGMLLLLLILIIVL